MKKLKLLLMDDEPFILSAIKRELMEYDFEIITETNPFRAKELLKNSNIDILLTDQRMPEISGLELILYGRTVSPDTVPILMSAYSDFEVIVAAINEGRIFHYLPKPWDVNKLKVTLMKALEFKNDQEQKKVILNKYLIDKQDWLETTNKLEVDILKNDKNQVAAFKKIIEVKDYDLFLHSVRVSELAEKFAEYIGLPEKQQYILRCAGLFHDLGKIVIKDRILYKNDRLDQDEYEEMKRHPAVGAEILNEIEHFEEIARIVEQHHEREDGNGYPKGLSGESICYEARIISILDAFDALTSDRIYRKALKVGEAFEILRKGGAGKFNNRVLKDFEAFILNNQL